MSFSRSFLKSIGLNDEQISAAIEEHTAVTTALKAQRDQFEGDANKYKADAEKLAQVQKELDELKARKDYKADYDKAVKDLEDYKAQVKRDQELSKVKAAYRKLLKDEQISDNWAEDIMAFTQFEGMKLGEDGALQDVDALKKTIGEKYGKYKVTVRDRGEDVPHPPRTDNGQPAGAVRKMVAQWHAERYGNGQTNNE